MDNKQTIEKYLGVMICRGWVLDGPGPARYGWAAIHPCKKTYLGRTLAEIAAKLGLHE